MNHVWELREDKNGKEVVPVLICTRCNKKMTTKNATAECKADIGA